MKTHAIARGSWSILIVLLCAGPSFAVPVVDETVGSWVDPYTDRFGLDEGASSNIRHDVAGRYLTQVVDSTTGVAVTPIIRPASSSGWLRVYLDLTASGANDVRAFAIPDGGGAIALSLVTSDLAGYTAMADLSALAPASGLAIRVELNKTGVAAPTLEGLRVTWQPQSRVTIGTSGTALACAGGEIEFRVRTAVSHVPTDGLVVWLPIPAGALPSDALNAGLSQDVTLSFVRASSGGTYTATVIEVDGVAIPAGSVFWRLGTRKAGDTFVLSAVVRPPNGTLNGTTYTALAMGAARNALVVTGSPGVATVMASPTPVIEKVVSGAFRIFNEWRTYNDATLTFSHIVSNRTMPTCGETIFVPVVWDAIGNLAVRPGFSTDRLDIGQGGKFTAEPIQIRGVDVPANAVYWDDVPPLRPGESRVYSFSVALWGVRTNPADVAFPEGLLLADTAHLASAFNPADARSDLAVRIGVPNDPNGVFALGDRIRGSSEVNAGNPYDNRFLTVTYGEGFAYLLHARNQGASALADIAMRFKVPEAVELTGLYLAPGPDSQPARQMYYYYDADHADPFGADIDVLTPPALFVGATVAPEWVKTLPLSVAIGQVRWVAFLVPRLASPYFDAAGGGIEGASRATGEVAVRVRVPVDPDVTTCPEFGLVGHAAFQAHSYIPVGGSSVIENPAANDWVAEVEWEEVKGVKPDLSRLTMSCTPSIREGAGEIACTASVSNWQSGADQTDVARDVAMTFSIPAVPVNGVTTPLAFAGIDPAGGTVRLEPDVATGFAGLPGEVRVGWESLGAGETRTVTLRLRVPEGLVDATSFQVWSAVQGRDDYCGTTGSSAGAAVLVRVSPYLNVSKAVDLSVAAPGSEVPYHLTVVNTGDGVATRTWVVDRVPAHTRLVSAASPIGEVWFTDRAEPDLPSVLSSDVRIDDPVIRAMFVPGVAGPLGVLPPAGMAPTFVAFPIDDAALSPAQFTSGGVITVSFVVAVDADAPVGTVLPNEAMVVSSELIQSVGNRVRTVVSDRPSIRVHETCPAVVTASEVYEMFVDYRNDSTTPGSVVVLDVALPEGTTCVSVSHAFEPPKAFVVSASCADVTGGRLILQVANAAHPLASLEGGRVRLRVKGSDGMASGTWYASDVTGRAQDAQGTVFEARSQCATRVENADMTVTKVADVSSPLAGETVRYSLLVENAGRHAAEGVVVRDFLPLGLAYVPGSAAVLTSGWTLLPAEPIAQATTFDGRPVTRLTWTGLRGDGATGFVPGQSGQVMMTFQAVVSGSAVPGTFLVNCAEVSTTTAEDLALSNTSCAAVTLPLPDAYLTKNGPVVAQPGDKATFVLQYGNRSRQAAGPTVIVDTLPARDGGGAALKLVGVRVPDGHAAWFFAAPDDAAPPIPDPGNPAASGWTAVPGATMPTHVAVIVGAMPGNAGPFLAEVEMELRDPLNQADVPPGTVVTNCARIMMRDGGRGCGCGQRPGLRHHGHPERGHRSVARLHTQRRLSRHPARRQRDLCLDSAQHRDGPGARDRDRGPVVGKHDPVVRRRDAGRGIG